MQLNHEFDKFDWCNFADIWPPLYQQLLSWQFVIPFRFLKYFILILTFLKKCSVLEKNFTFLKIHIGNYRKRGSSVLQRVFCIMRDCSWLQGYSRLEEMGSVMNVAIAWNPPSGIFIRGHLSACFSNPDKFYRHDCSFFFILKQFGFGMFFCALKKIFFFENKNNHVYDTVLTSNWIFCHKHMNRWVSVCRHHQKCNCVCAVTP